MYNVVKEKLFKNFEARRSEDGTIEFLENGGIVAIFFPKQEVINVFLSASPEVVWNHNGFVIFVLARKYTVMTNSRCKKVEAAWLIGMCGAAWAKNLCHPFFLESDHYMGYVSASTISPLGSIQGTSKRNVVTFKIFDYDVTYTTIGRLLPIDYINPALMYPVKLGRKSSKKGKEVHAYLRNKNAWHYTDGYYTSGSAEIRKFIAEEAKKTNHTEFSKISYTVV